MINIEGIVKNAVVGDVLVVVCKNENFSSGRIVHYMICERLMEDATYSDSYYMDGFQIINLTTKCVTCVVGDTMEDLIKSLLEVEDDTIEVVYFTTYGELE